MRQGHIPGENLAQVQEEEATLSLTGPAGLPPMCSQTVCVKKSHGHTLQENCNIEYILTNQENCQSSDVQSSKNYLKIFNKLRSEPHNQEDLDVNVV